ncbi:MAG: AAA family ATPase [Acidobacteria bacterium]|nr:AAA family ATPase [Acidobacteriota bacterium]
MILLRGRIHGFGKLCDLPFDFQNGLNLVFAENEGGKTTLQRFLVGLLYGQLRSDLRVQRRLDSWVEQYKPWRGSEYGGILWCRFADGREVEIHRSFGKEEIRIEIRASTGEDITGQYEQQRNGEVLFAPCHLGMPKDLFESVGMIRENKVAEIYGYETIRDRIANLAQSGDEELSIRRSLSSLEGKLDSIGSDRAPTKPYKQAQDLVQSLQSERKDLEERRVQFQGWIEDRNRVACEITKLEQDLVKIRAALLSARRIEAASRVQALEEINGDLANLRAEIEALGARADFPSDGLEELNRLVGARDSIGRQLSEVRAEREASLAQLDRAKLQRQELAAYEAFAASSDAEKITEWFVSYLGISLQKDGLQKTISRLQSEAGVLEKRLSELSPALIDPDTDWQRLAREAAEEEQDASQSCSLLAEKIAAENSSRSSAARSALNRRLLGGMFLVFAALSLSTQLIPIPAFLSLELGIGIGAVCAVAAVILLISGSRRAQAAQQAKKMLGSLEAELADIRKEGGKKRRQLNLVMTDSGFHKLDDFLAAAKQADQDRRKMADLQARLVEAEQQEHRLEEQSRDLYQSLKDGLAKVGLSCSPGNLKFQIDALRSNLRRFRDLDINYGNCIEKAEAIGSRDSELTEEYNLTCARIQSLLDRAQVDSPERFREECARRQKLLALLDRESSRKREFNRLAGDLTLQQWEEQLCEFTARQNSQAAAESGGVTPRVEVESSAPLLPYQPTISEAEEQEKQIVSQLSGTREEYARTVERINQAFRSYRLDSEIEEDLALAERSLRELETNRLALEIALETIERLSRQQQEVLAPQLNAAVEQRFLRLCGRRYEEVKIDPDFQVWVREPGSGELRSAEHLSRGTQDQIYFSMRFGILDLVSNEAESCPCLLDEPFAAYDRIRLREAFEILAGEAVRRQLILFTCREDLLELALHQNAHIVRLDQNGFGRELHE